MKTTKQITTGIKTLILILVLTVTAQKNNSLMAQKASLGISIKNTCSGSGLGSIVSPQLVFRTSRHEIFMGINIQDKRKNFSGFRSGYSFVLNPGDDNEVFLFYDVAYNYNAFLGNKTAEVESRIRKENAGYFQNVQLNVLEHHFGFGVNFYKAGPVNFFGAIGAGFYNTFGIKDATMFKDRDIYGASVMLSFGVKVKIQHSNKHSREELYKQL